MVPSVLVTQTVNGCLPSSRESGNGDDTGKTVSGQRELVLDMVRGGGGRRGCQQTPRVGRGQHGRLNGLLCGCCPPWKCLGSRGAGAVPGQAHDQRPLPVSFPFSPKVSGC